MHFDSPSHHPGRRSQGQVLVVFAIFLIVLIGASAITIDYATWLKVRRDYQNMADAAALQGAALLTRPLDNAKRILAREAAWESLQDQLDLGPAIDPSVLRSSDTPSGSPVVDPLTGYRMWVSTPPIGLSSVTSAKYPGASTGADDRTIFVWVERDSDAFMSRIFNQGSTNVSAWAVAGSAGGGFAVITLRRPGQAGDTGAPSDIDIEGGSTLRVVNGDVGGNWGMAINGTGSTMIMDNGGSSDSFSVFLNKNVPSGSNSWLPSQLVDQAGNPVTAQYYPAVADPNYPLPASIPNPAAPTAQVPLGDQLGHVDVRGSGSDPSPGSTSMVGGTLTCSADSPRIGPGFYYSIHVDAGKCLILDPTQQHSSIYTSIPDVASALDPGQLAGVFYVYGDASGPKHGVEVQGDGMIVGNGVTVVMIPHPTAQNKNLLSLSGGASSPAVMDLNRGDLGVAGVSSRRLGGWYVRNGVGASPYACDSGGNCTYTSALEADAKNIGMALYVVKREQWLTGIAADNNTSVITVSSFSGLAWTGLTYAPHDNVKLAGQPGHNGIGQLVSWTFKFAGATEVTQKFTGPENGLPYLIEPKLTQ
jgi:hypothetical protein